MSVSWATVNPTYSAATSECAEPATSASSATTSCFWVRLRAIALLRIAFPPSRIRLKTGHEPHRSVDAGNARWRSGWWPFPIDRYCDDPRSEEHTSELQSLMRISYAVFCLKKKNNTLT